MKVNFTQLCPTLWNPMDYRVHGILQALILEWVAYPFSSRSSWPRNQTGVSCIAGGFFTSWSTGKPKTSHRLEENIWKRQIRYKKFVTQNIQRTQYKNMNKLKNIGKRSEQTSYQKYIEMTNKQMRICSVSCVTWETWLKTMRYQYAPIRMAKLKTLTTLNADEDVKQQEFINYYRNTKLYTHFENLVVFYKTNILLSWSNDCTHWCLPKGIKKRMSTQNPMFITVLLIIVKAWKQPRWPSVDYWTNYGTSTQRTITQN